MFNFHETRPCKHEIMLTMKESDRLKELAKKHGFEEWRVLLQALRLYDAVENGTVELVWKDEPFGLPALD